ncbi:hypothetical protein Ancab_037972 [Ancistrocladus abbreviatus]
MEQRTNAVLLKEDVKVALRPKASESGLVKREEIGKVVRNRALELKDAANRALSVDGSSTLIGS